MPCMACNIIQLIKTNWHTEENPWKLQ